MKIKLSATAKSNLRIVAVVLAVVCAAWIVVNSLRQPSSSLPVGPPTRKVYPTAAPVQFVYLNCPDCAEIGMFINIWENPDRIGVAGKCQHGQMVNLISHKQHTDGLHYYQIRCGSINGWVSQQMVSFTPPN
jgi:hypothetical protein